jgi:eukaryotic-like serine/threonine-protein kinase
MARPPAPGKDDRSDIEEQETLERPAGASTPRPRAEGRGPALEAGQRFGPYRLVRLLGRGAFGQVWEAESEENGRRIALKVLSVAEATPEMLQRFDREGRLAASLNHPHCVYVLAADPIEGSPTIAMELMPGGTLQDLLRDGPLPPARAVDYALDILEGLEAAHVAGILHRDLKPSNCFLDEHSRAKIGDFGLSKTLELDAQLTTEGSFMGTPSYASPEQVRGSGVDARSDLYSLGATLYALLCGKPPFEGRDLGGVMARILTEEPKPFAAHGVSVPKGLQAVVLRLLQKDPAKRLRSHAAVRAALVPYSSRGLTAVELPRRFLAFAADLILLALLDVPIAVLFFARGFSTTTIAFLSLATKFLYFFVSETWWGRSPGKALFGLRVTGADGSLALAPLPVALRTAVFLTLYEGDTLMAVFPGLQNLSWGWRIGLGAFAALNTFIPLLTMRARNGFAGLHELASRTRVRVVRGREAVVVPSSRAVQPLGEGALPRTFGPYEETGRRWERGDEALLLARDSVLHRPVWIHLFADAARARSLTELAAHAPGRVRWLQGVRAGSGGWDAYEAPEGTSVVEWVRERGALGWREVREVLLGLARALSAPGGRGLALDRAWVDAAPGHARIADFPVVAEAPPAASAVTDAESWPRFLHQATLFGLEGRAVAEPDLLPGVPRAGFPEHARTLLSRLCGAGPAPDSPDAVAQELELLRRRPAAVTRRTRLFTLGVPAAAPLAVMGIILLTMTLARMVPTWTEFFQVEERIDALEKLEGQKGAQAEAQREALRMVLAASYEQARKDRRLSGMVQALPPETRRVLDDAARDYPSLTPEQVEAARVRAGLDDVAVRKGGARVALSADGESDTSPAEVAQMLMSMWMGIAVAALLASPFFGSGFLLYLSGITLQGEDGRPARPRQRVMRSLFAWAPLLAYAPRYRSSFGTIDVVLFALAAAGVVYALFRPQRGLPDLLAGTRLVPR